MATFSNLVARLERRFGAVPALPSGITSDVMRDAYEAHGYDVAMTIPAAHDARLMAYASAELALTVAINAASYFKYTDGEESVDKSMIAKEYRTLAAQFRADYDAELAKDIVSGPASGFAIAPRPDRRREA